MKLIEYLNQHELFPLMGVSQLNEVGEELDKLLKHQYGQRTVGPIVTSYQLDDGTFPVGAAEEIAKSIYLINKNKWDSLFLFVESEYTPFTDRESKTITKYGRITDDTSSTTQDNKVTDKIAGFDSVDYVNKDYTVQQAKNGSTSKTTNSGQNEMLSTGRDKQAERLVDYTLSFWDRYGITRTVLADALRVLALPLYDLD